MHWQGKALQKCTTSRQDRINHWAKRANALGFALLGASRFNTKTLLIVFFVFRLFTTRQKIVELFDYCV